MLTPEEIEQLKVIANPVTWAKVYLNWEARPYQIEPLKAIATKRQVVLRMGRRTGKCLPGWVRVFDPYTGEMVPVAKLYEQKKANVVAMNEDHRLFPTITNQVWDNGFKEVYRVTLASGREIDATGNHPLYTPGGWVEIDDLCPGDLVAVPFSLPYFGNEELEDCEIKALAYRLVPGSVLNCRDDTALREIANVIGYFGGYLTQVRDYDYIVTDPEGKLASFLEEHFFQPDRIPEVIFRLKRRCMVVYLSSLFAAAKEKDENLILPLPTKEMALDVQHLLLRFGVHGIISCVNSNTCLILTDIHLRRFIDTVCCNKDTDYSSQYEEDIIWDRVVSIEYIGIHRTYDLTVPIYHSFVANDIIVHNTEMMCIGILWHAFTQVNKGENDEQYDILIIAPYETQVDLIFERLNQLIDNSEIMRSVVKRRVHHCIELTNGSSIKGLTAGSRYSNGANNTRGQRADLLILDECDYLAEADITNIINIRNEAPERIKIVCGSTPSGRRGSFYRWCTEAPRNGWTHFHIPSTVNKELLKVNPDTGLTYLEELRMSLTELRFLQEVMAEFGEEQVGVYQKKHLDNAVALGEALGIRYYKNSPPPKRGPRVLGCDWDKAGASTNMIILEYDMERNIVYPVERVEIPRHEFTYDKAVMKIIELNEIYDLDYIFVDRGAGEYQIETLRKYGINNPESGLAQKVYGVHFGSKISVRDPYTRKSDKKPIKPFMVNNSVILFERGRIALNPKDRRLLDQLTNYRIKSISSSGVPVYNDDEEHMVDAFNLAIHGIITKYTDVVKVNPGKQMFLISKNNIPPINRQKAVEKPASTVRPGVGAVKTLNPYANMFRRSFGSSRRNIF